MYEKKYVGSFITVLFISTMKNAALNFLLAKVKT